VQHEIEKVAYLLKPYTKRAYLVGGCVRDLLLSNKIKDLDIEVYDIKPYDFDKLMQKSGALGVGKSFFVYKIGDIDLALPRVEKKVGVGHKAFEVKITDDEKTASKRRDFTMNAMMINIFTGEFLDFWDGKKSVENRTISLIDEVSFKEDSLRVLRAVQFSARFGFNIDSKTMKIMREIDLEDLSKTRIFWELEKLFKAKYLHIGFINMYKLQIFHKLFECGAKKEIKDELKIAVKGFRRELKPYYFIYIVANMSGQNAHKWAKKIQAPKHYLKALKNQPFLNHLPNNAELYKIAMDIPIKNWLGNYKDGIKNRAKALDIWNKVFTGGISMSEIINDGFEKDEIKKEYRRRVMERINE